MNNKECPVHEIIVDDLRQYLCAQCRCMFTKKGLELALKKRFGPDWPEAKRILVRQKRTKNLNYESTATD